MKSFLTVTLASAVAALVMSNSALADGHGHWEHHGHGGHHDHWGHEGHHHHGHHHHGYGREVVVIHEPPVYYAPPPRVIHHYHEPRVVYREAYPAYRYDGGGPLPIIAGGVLGGVVGEQLGRGDHAAIIGGSVLGSVLGNEIGR